MQSQELRGLYAKAVVSDSSSWLAPLRSSISWNVNDPLVPGTHTSDDRDPCNFAHIPSLELFLRTSLIFPHLPMFFSLTRGNLPERILARTLPPITARINYSLCSAPSWSHKIFLVPLIFPPFRSLQDTFHNSRVKISGEPPLSQPFFPSAAPPRDTAPTSYFSPRALHQGGTF